MLFKGLKVIDCGSFIAAPVAATMLGDFGADVIKVEPPGAGDSYRTLWSAPGMPVSDQPYNWMLDNRGKRSLALDLRQPEGQEVLHRLAAGADVFITNYPLTVRKKLGLDAARIRALNPRLVYASFTGYGETGAEVNKPGFDLTAYWARSGLMATVRTDANTPPARGVTGMGDHPSGTSLFAAILLGLLQRERTGQGTQVGSSLLANGLWSNGVMAQAALCGGKYVPRPPRDQLPNALVGYYRCGDDRWFVLVSSNEERDWPLMAKCLEQPELIDDPRFATQADRYAHSRELIAIFDAAFASRSRDEWRRRLDEAGIVFECIAELADIPHDTQMREAGVVVPFEDDGAPTITSPMYVEGAPKRPPRKPAALGQHNEELLREAGYDDAAIARLRAARVVA
ncbi:CaiB/BaiF CoA transferase family protein [Ottowia sp.]|uniref:CaiB/BaiF CoA transferase family protein n=1 Tax=Ottowia sp. TaxID=1898956 RepID=UPI0039E528D4